MFILITGLFVLFMFFSHKLFKMIFYRTSSSKKDESPEFQKYHTVEVHARGDGEDLNPLLSEPIVINQSDW